MKRSVICDLRPATCDRGPAHERRIHSGSRALRVLRESRKRAPLLVIALLLAAFVLPARADGPAFLIRDINTTPNLRSDSSPGNFYTAGSTLYFTADDGSSGVELWRTDGTGPSTRLVKDINPGGGSEP